MVERRIGTRTVNEQTAATEAPAEAMKPAIKRTRTKKPPQRFEVHWAVCDGTMKQLALFNFKDRAGADKKLAEFEKRKTGTYFLQLVQETIVLQACAAAH
jgi:hypothetical protein